MAKLPEQLKADLTLLDVHSHVGVDPRLYLGHSLPFCRSFDVARAEAAGVGITHSVCFPWVTSLYYDLQELAKSGNVVLSGNGIGDAPGLVMTPLLQQVIGAQPELQRLLDSQIPLERRGEINDIGPAAVFLASPGAKYITGQMLYVDGGITAQQMIWKGPDA
tara:strand:- start:512 stop:1000 length:489 start_codon:yes stop_codon:yes gene_type:complete